MLNSLSIDLLILSSHAPSSLPLCQYRCLRTLVAYCFAKTCGLAKPMLCYYALALVSTVGATKPEFGCTYGAYQPAKPVGGIGAGTWHWQHYVLGFAKPLRGYQRFSLREYRRCLCCTYVQARSLVTPKGFGEANNQLNYRFALW